ncbi:NAC domain containing protein 85 [Hirschfeldia incana]|nr:NAC domain containing protein 85 [Hirschfeldia incana]
MDRTWIVDVPWIAKNVKNVSVSSDLQIEDCEAYINCPNCGYRNDNRNVIMTPWPGLPKGVKFEPTDEEVIEHLEAKCGIDGSKPNPFIQDFIFSVDDINYTHPQNLPGVNKDGASSFFFNKTVHAYPKGERKRRVITPSASGLKDASLRWRKSGKTKPVMLNGVQKGCKKFMVLYKSAKKGLKPEKSKWVMHQYHLGREEAETGEYVVSKIMYQQQQGLENTPEVSFGSQVIAQVAGEFIVTEEDIVVSKNNECSSSLVEKSPNYLDFNMSYGNCMVSDLANADLGSLPDIHSFASEDSLMNCLEWI